MSLVGKWWLDIIRFHAAATVLLLAGCAAESTGSGGPGFTYRDGSTIGPDGAVVGGSGATGSGGTGGSKPPNKDGGGGEEDSGPVCDEDVFTVTPKPAAVMLLMDMSASMNDEIDGKSKWEHSRDALTALLSDPAVASLQIRFGFDYFPDTAFNMFPPPINRPFPGCGVDDPVVEDVSQDGNQRIIDWLAAAEPDGATPLHCAIDKFTDDSYAPNFNGETIDKYLVVISDGADTCGADCVSNGDETKWAKEDEVKQVAEELAAKEIRSVAVGFGESVSPAQLNAISEAGGVFERYLKALDGDALKEAFYAVANAVTSCLWDIDDPDVSADPDNVNFYFKGRAVPYIGKNGDCAKDDGWMWTDDSLHDEVQFCGDACEDLRSDVGEMVAKYGCPSVIIE